MAKDVVEDTEKLTDKEIRVNFSKALVSPGCCTAEAIVALYGSSKLGDTGLTGLDSDTIQRVLLKQNEMIEQGDVRCVEAMLMDSSTTLQAMSTYFVRKAARSEYVDHEDKYTRLALKAQNQQRQTLATLIELKNPKRATFIKQQNNAVNQQINNEQIEAQPQNSKKSKNNSANKLLKEVPSERLDIGAQSETVSANPELEALGEIDRPKNRGRKAKGQSERV